MIRFRLPAWLVLMSILRSVFAGVILATTWACADAGSPVISREEPSNPQAETDVLTWMPCDISTSQGLQHNAAECASLEVPVRRDAATGRTISLAIKRYKQTDRPRGQLWILAGGPGSAASDFEMDADFYLGLGRDLELYLLDHRGTGQSNRLTCETEEDPSSPAGTVIHDTEWLNCARTMLDRWGEDLAGFSTTEAASDLGEAIALSRREADSVYIYAVSYGTYVAERYLQLYPNQASGVILDSICAPGLCDLLLDYDRQFDATARTIFGYCRTDATCSNELGTDAWSHVTELSAALSQGHCPQIGWTSTTLRQILGFMVNTARLRDYMPALVRRAERCSDQDVEALGHFKEFVAGFDTEPSSFSQVLFAHVTLSELSPRPPPLAAEIADNVAGLHASLDTGLRLAAAVGNWPNYPRDQYFGAFGATTLPLLMLNGTLDPATPLAVARPAGDFYHGTNQTFIEIPHSPHTTLTQSLMDDSENTCAAELARQFLDSPTTPLDTSCLARVLPVNFEGYANITPRLFGTDSAWNEAP